MFPKRLEQLRLEKDLTHQQMANILGITRQAYGNYESGKRQPDFETTRKLADFFNVSVDYLLGRSDIRTPLERAKNFLKNESGGFKGLRLGSIANAISLISGTGPMFPSLELVDVLESNELQLTAGGQPLNQERRLNLLRMLDNPALLEGRAENNHVPILGQIKMGIPLLAEENYAGELEIPSDIHANFALEAKGDSMIGVGMLDGDYALCRKQETAYSGDIVVALHDIATGFSDATLKYYFNNDEGPVLRAANPDFEDIPLNSNCRIAGILVAILRKEPPAYKIYNSYIATRDANKEMWDPVIEKAFQLGIKPGQLINVLDTMCQVMKGTNK